MKAEKITWADVKKALRSVQRKLRDGTISQKRYKQDAFVCGTAHCLGGWLAIELGSKHDAASIVGYHNYIDTAAFVVGRPLHDLFFKWECGRLGDNLTPKQGVKAITEWFRDPRDPWSRVPS